MIFLAYLGTISLLPTPHSLQLFIYVSLLSSCCPPITALYQPLLITLLTYLCTIRFVSYTPSPSIPLIFSQLFQYVIYIYSFAVFYPLSALFYYIAGLNRYYLSLLLNSEISTTIFQPSLPKYLVSSLSCCGQTITNYIHHQPALITLLDYLGTTSLCCLPHNSLPLPFIQLGIYIPSYGSASSMVSCFKRATSSTYHTLK